MSWLKRIQKKLRDYTSHLKKLGMTMGADLISEMVTALDRRIEDLKEAKINLNNVLKLAKKFDKANK